MPEDSPNRKDIFGRPQDDTGAGSGSGTFEADPVENGSVQKPPMTDPLEGKALDPVETDPGKASETDPGKAGETDPGKPVDEKTFFEDATKADNTASLRRKSVIARTSSLSEVIAPKRLASRSLPVSQRSASGSRLADKSLNTKSDSPRPLRWISAPLADGHVQL